MLPKKGGVEVLTEIRGVDALKNIPVVVLTASEADEDKLRCELLEVDSYIPKPVNLQKFLAVIRQLKRFWLDDVVLPSTAP